MEGFWVCPCYYFNLDHVHAFEVNLPMISSYHTSVCITALPWRAVTALPSKDTTPEKCVSAPNKCPVHGTRLLANRSLHVIKKAIENERKDDHPCVPGECGASTSAVLHPLPGDKE